jgi:hypothetical protein
MLVVDFDFGDGAAFRFIDRLDCVGRYQRIAEEDGLEKADAIKSECDRRWAAMTQPLGDRRCQLSRCRRHESDGERAMSDSLLEPRAPHEDGVGVFRREVARDTGKQVDV